MSSRSKTERTLLNAILTNPDDDSPRFEYAKWLEQNGQHFRAELIRVQCGIEALRAREQSLLRENELYWHGEFAGLGISHLEFHRGFPEVLHAQFPFFMEKHSEIEQLTPIRGLHVGIGSDQHVEQLASLPALRHLRTLEIGDQYLPKLPNVFGKQSLQAIADSPFLKNLQFLTLHSRNIGLDGAQLIAQAKNLKQMEKLWLHDPCFDESDPFPVALEFVKAPHLAHLTGLRLGETVDMGKNAIAAMRQKERPNNYAQKL